MYVKLVDANGSSTSIEYYLMFEPDSTKLSESYNRTIIPIEERTYWQICKLFKSSRSEYDLDNGSIESEWIYCRITVEESFHPETPEVVELYLVVSIGSVSISERITTSVYETLVNHLGLRFSGKREVNYYQLP